MLNNNQIKLNFKLSIYPIEAIYNACYQFIDNYYIFLDSKKKGEIEISLKSKKKLDDKEIEEQKGEFMNELLYNSIRLTVANRNKKLREFIVGRALFSAVENESELESEPELEPEFEQCDYINDPLGIAIPWEEKYQKKESKGKK